MAKTMRAADQAEIQASSGQHPFQVLARAVDLSHSPVTALIDGEVACMFGTYSHSLLGEIGIPWLLTANIIDRHPKLFYKYSRRIMEDMKSDYPILVQMVDARHSRALAWLQRLGFTKGPAEKYGAANLPFHRMIWRRYV